MNGNIEGLRIATVARQSSYTDGSMSTADQLDAMRGWTDKGGATVASEYVEHDVSGRRPLAKRPGLLQAVIDVEENRADAIAGAYFDRLLRSLETQAEVVRRVEAAGGQVIALDVGKISNGSAAQWLQGNVIGMMSEYYARSVGERTADSKQRNIDNGVPPFPWITPAYQRRADGRLEPHPTNAPLVREAIRMRLTDPPTSWTRITEWLIGQGLQSDRTKEPITQTGVRKMLASRLMVGEIHFGGFTPNLHAIDEPIMSHSTYRRLHQSRAVRGRYSKSPRLLARLGILRCGTCGARMVVHSTSSNGKRFEYYICGDRLCTGQANIPVAVAEDTVRDEAMRLSAEVVGRASDADAVEVARIEAETADAALNEAIRSLAGLGAEKATREVLDELQAERDRKVDRHERLRASSSSSLTVSTVGDWDKLTFDERRGVIQAVITSAVVAPGRGPDRIVVEGRTLLGE